MSYLKTFTPWNLQAEKYFLQGDYVQAASVYEEEIANTPDIKSHYWYLGLILLLQGQDVEAQTTWLMAIMEGEPEEIESGSVELITILQTEAERREKLEEYAIAQKIRENIQEISPQNIHNLLHLIRLYIKLKTYKADILQELGIIELLQSEPKIEVEIELLMSTLDSILEEDYAHPLSLEFAEACVPYCQNNPPSLLKILLPAALAIGYSYKQSKIAARLCELYLTISPKNAEVLGHLASFYTNAGDYDKGIETAKLFYSLVEQLADKVYAQRQILRCLINAGNHWEESYTENQKLQNLLSLLIKEGNSNLVEGQIIRLFNTNFFTPYLEDNPKSNRIIQNNLLNYCEVNVANRKKEKIEQYSQGISKRKQQEPSNRKLKIGYLSYCLRSHSVGWLARWLFEYHNREEFHLHGYFIDNYPKSDLLHEWYLGKVDEVRKSKDSQEIAEQIYHDEIDILIDLDSVTLDTTCEIIALKPAPIQVAWLGWDASGSPSVDYFIADPYVLPESAQEYYKEEIWRLPQTYIAVDGFEVGVPTIRREDLNIPNDAVVYFCAQRVFKINPNITKLHLRIIKEVPNSYFLIKGLADEEATQKFFYQLAEEEGVDASRLRFLPIVSAETIHRANLGIADIVLDTYPYNGATTTLETLWMCLPIVTKVGEQFAARNSYTMMMNAGVTEGIAWTDEEYVEWGVRLGKDEALRQQIAWKLKKSRQTSPLWNGQQFTREMEKAYQQMWQIYLQK